MKYFDKNNNRLIFCNQKANEKYWDCHWEEKIKRILQNPPKHRFLTSITTKYLPLKSKILEGGCGMGDKVLALEKKGYESYGVDFASNTVKTIKKNYPDLKIEVADVKQLPFNDNFFDGYWSLGVIEHFFDGYDEILQEAKRVIKPQGYLFLTFPVMNLLRQYKAKHNKYCKITDSQKLKDNFYQFALNIQSVLINLKKYNFEIIDTLAIDSLKGLKDEIKILEKPLSLFIQKMPKMSIITGIISDKLIGKLFSHMALLICKATKL